jgi:hypothetical protein
MSKELIPIDTEYNGYYFRSRLEARYAVYFDKLGWKYEYEAEGYKLDSGFYLPDFYFPEIDCFAEVKAKKLNELEMKLCYELTERLSNNNQQIKVLLLEGQPDYKTFRGISADFLYDDIIPITKGDKYYPFFLNGSTLFDKHIFSKEGKALIKAREARFEFEHKSKY